MLQREKFKKIAKGQLKGGLFLTYNLNVQWIMEETFDRWYKEGLPENADMVDYFGFDRIEFISASPYDPVPAFEEKIISEDSDNKIMQNKKGAIVKINKAHENASMPQWLEHPIKNREDFNNFKKRLNFNSTQRHPENWNEFKDRCNNVHHPIGIASGSFYGHTLQQWIGTEELCMLFYDDEKFVHEMMDYLEQFFYDLIEKYVNEIKFDFASFGEDIAYKGKSFVSPEMFKKFIQPHYKSIVELLQKNGIEVIFVDSDGYIDELIPLWLEVGINGFSPLEVAAGANALKLKKEYGDDIILAGNIDKRALIAGRQEIDLEIEKVKQRLDLGGYFPMVDHSTPPEVSLENYMYFVEKLKELR